MIFKKTGVKKLRWVVVAIGFLSCSEQPVIVPSGEYRLNAPASMVKIPGTDLAVVASANVNLDQVTGALMAVDLSTNKLLTDTLFEIPSFAGDMFLDTSRSRIYVPNHNNALLVYEYSVPGSDGKAISFSAVDVAEPVQNDGEKLIPNGVETDDGPSQAVMIPNTSLGDLILVTNQLGTVSMIPAETLKLKDMDSDKYFGLRLYSAFNFTNAKDFPGRGAARMGVSALTGLIYITSVLNNNIYVLDPDNQTIEAMINLDSISLPTVGMRGILIDDVNGIAYVAHSGLDSIIVLDVSGMTKNGIPYEVIQPPVIDIIPVGDGPEDLALKSADPILFVSNQNEDSIYMVDTSLRQVVKKTYLDLGKSPGRLVLDEARNTVYSLDFLSNTISLIDATTGDFVEEIQ